MVMVFFLITSEIDIKLIFYGCFKTLPSNPTSPAQYRENRSLAGQTYEWGEPDLSVLSAAWPASRVIAAVCTSFVPNDQWMLWYGKRHTQGQNQRQAVSSPGLLSREKGLSNKSCLWARLSGTGSSVLRYCRYWKSDGSHSRAKSVFPFYVCSSYWQKQSSEGKTGLFPLGFSPQRCWFPGLGSCCVQSFSEGIGTSYLHPLSYGHGITLPSIIVMGKQLICKRKGWVSSPPGISAGTRKASARVSGDTVSNHCTHLRS